MSSHDATLERLREKAAEETTNETSQSFEIDEEPEQEVEIEQEKKTSIREYIVLGQWQELARIEASSAEAALKILGKGEGKFAVVPARNFNSFAVETETTTVTHVTPA